MGACRRGPARVHCWAFFRRNALRAKFPDSVSPWVSPTNYDAGLHIDTISFGQQNLYKYSEGLDRKQGPWHVGTVPLILNSEDLQGGARLWISQAHGWFFAAGRAAPCDSSGAGRAIRVHGARVWSLGNDACPMAAQRRLGECGVPCARAFPSAAFAFVVVSIANRHKWSLFLMLKTGGILALCGMLQTRGRQSLLHLSTKCTSAWT